MWERGGESGCDFCPIRYNSGMEGSPARGTEMIHGKEWSYGLRERGPPAASGVEGKDRGGGHGARGEQGGAVGGLHPRGGPALPGDPEGPQPELRAHPAAQPGGGHHRRHRRAGPGGHRPRGRDAGDGGQVRPVQDLRRHRRVPPVCQDQGCGRVRPDGVQHLRLLRRHQPGGHLRPPLL